MKITHPYTNLSAGQWMRGNLHTHTTRSDGTRPQQEVLDDYASRGYDFLSLSDHDTYTSAEELAQLDGKGMVLIPGNEISAQGPHLLHVNAQSLVAPDADRQAVLTAIAKEKQSLAIMNHPNWQSRFNHCSIEQLEAWSPYVGLEIYNGVIDWMDGDAYATNKWDMLLAGGRRVWGFANDDSHKPYNVAIGWNVAYAHERNVAGVMDALANGRFYASSGVKITDISVTGNRISVETANARRIVALKELRERITFVDDSRIDLTVPEGIKYVRFECWGDGERFAWTQPFFIEA